MCPTVQVPTEEIQENNSFQWDELPLESCHSFPSLDVLGMKVLMSLMNLANCFVMSFLSLFKICLERHCLGTSKIKNFSPGEL